MGHPGCDTPPAALRVPDPQLTMGNSHRAPWLDLYVGACHRGSVVNVPDDTAHAGRRGWEPTEAGAHLRGRAIADTKPELALRRAVFGRGLRYRINRRVGRYRPDIVFPASRTVVFVDGCFWHNCPLHGPRVFRGPNADEWRYKLRVNQERDVRAARDLEGAGWRVVRIWECEIRQDVDAAADRVEAAVQEARSPGSGRAPGSV